MGCGRYEHPVHQAWVEIEKSDVVSIINHDIDHATFDKGRVFFCPGCKVSVNRTDDVVRDGGVYC